MAKGLPGARAATAGAQALHEATPLPAAPSWAGYWTFVSAAIIVMFVLYLAQKGTLSTWLGFFSWTSPANVGTTAAPVGTSNGSTVIPGTTTPGTPGLTLNPFAGLPGILNPANVPGLFANPTNPATGGSQ